MNELLLVLIGESNFSYDILKNCKNNNLLLKIIKLAFLHRQRGETKTILHWILSKEIMDQYYCISLH